MKKLKVFYHGEKELLAYTLKGELLGEEQHVKELLAYQNGIKPEDIMVKIENRK